ncbi:MAG: 3-phosphoshikimate 1-carboxyvinyltransferase [Eubacteriales bacterium]|nr:3-phosphoshikimate 1-carboxyvinyltransferase [Eubacteriales bacterium]
MRIKITPTKLKGSVSVPPSKSYAHRMLICAALGNGESIIKGISESEDMYATLDCIKALGADAVKVGDTVNVKRGARAGVCENEKHCGLIEDVNGAGDIDSASGPRIFPCRESGSTLRFFIPVALAFGGEALFTGTPRLIERGIGIYEEMFGAKGIDIRKTDDGIYANGRLEAGEFVLRGDVSSQFVTGLLFALPLLSGDSVIRVLPPVESRGYIDITIDVLKRFGVTVTETEPNVFLVPGGQEYDARDLSVEGDWSNGAALLAFNAIGSDLGIGGLNNESMQGDRVCVDIIKSLTESSADDGDTDDGDKNNCGADDGGAKNCTANGSESGIDISGCPDLGPVMFALAAATGKGAVFTGTRRLRIKESDRAQAMADELKKFGVPVTVGENDVIIGAAALKTPTEVLDSHNDHRIVMAMTLLCSIVGGEIDGAEAIRKSWPDFFEVLGGVGLKAN